MKTLKYHFEKTYGDGSFSRELKRYKQKGFYLPYAKVMIAHFLYKQHTELTPSLYVEKKLQACQKTIIKNPVNPKYLI